MVKSYVFNIKVKQTSDNIFPWLFGHILILVNVCPNQAAVGDSVIVVQTTER